MLIIAYYNKSKSLTFLNTFVLTGYIRYSKKFVNIHYKRYRLRLSNLFLYSGCFRQHNQIFLVTFTSHF